MATPSSVAPWAGSPSTIPSSGSPTDASTGGYWEVAADGGIFSFDAPFLGSTGSIHLNQPIVGMEGDPNGLGYRFVAADGGIFSYGTASFEGSTGGLALVAPMVAMAADDATGGYWMAAADGGIFNYGGAPYLGRANSPSLRSVSRAFLEVGSDAPLTLLAQAGPRPADMVSRGSAAPGRSRDHTGSRRQRHLLLREKRKLILPLYLTQITGFDKRLSSTATTGRQPGHFHPPISPVQRVYKHRLI